MFDTLHFSYIICISNNFLSSEAYFSHLLHAEPARSALFVKQNALFSTKNTSNTCYLGGCSVLNALNAG